MKLLATYAVVVTLAAGAAAVEAHNEHVRAVVLRQQLAAATHTIKVATPAAIVSPSLTARREAEQRKLEADVDDVVYSAARSMGESIEQANQDVLENRRHPLFKPKP
jgi:uncharacterized cupredoxin-like copper-binding protein